MAKAGNIISPVARLSYPSIFEPKQGTDAAGKPQGKPKYQVQLVFEPDALASSDDLAALRAAAIACAVDEFGAKAEKEIASGKIKLPFREDAHDADFAAEKGYIVGSTFLPAWSYQRPGVVASYAGPDGKPAVILEDDEPGVYAGCYVRCSLRPFAWTYQGKRGVTFGLQNIQKVKDGERFDGRASASDEFEATDESPVEV